MSRKFLSSIFVLALAVAASVLAHVMVPRRMMADERSPEISLVAMIPDSFRGWATQQNNSQFVVDPQAVASIHQIYSQTLTRIYVDEQGQSVMLSIAYGRDQRDQLQVHYPEICYPAQGFQLLSSRSGELQTARGKLPVRRLETILNLQRPEQVTYWLVIGNTVTLGGVDKKLREMRLGLRGVVPDGLIFRVSSIDANSARAFASQDRFVNDLLDSLPLASRQIVAGAY